MFLDKTTEFIAHFIGIFHIAVEEERMRDDYEKFEALKARDVEHGPLLNININVHSTYTLKHFAGGSGQGPFGFAPTDALPRTFPAPQLDYQMGGPGFGNPAPLARFDDLPFLPFVPDDRPLLQLEPAGSVVTVTYQSARMTDNDMFAVSDARAFVAPDIYLEQLETLARLSAMIQAVDAGDIPPLEHGAQDYAMTLFTAMQEVEAAPLTGLNVTMKSGDDAAGQFENGQSVTELSVVSDLMPAYLQPEEPDEPEPEDAGQITSEPPAGVVDVDPGHAVVAGANLLVNEVIINMSWLDAPVLTVMGDVMDLDAIFQTNILMSHQYGAGTAQAPSTVLNMAAMSHVSSQPVIENADQSAGEGAVEDTTVPTFPKNWAVARIEADIVAVNWVQQFTFATDFDRAEVSFSGTDTLIGLGENSIFNAVNLAEIGYGYDLIIIGGDMISVTLINQINLLLDDDHISYAGDFDAGVTGGDNLLANSASLSSVGLDSYIQMDAAFAASEQSLAGGGIGDFSGVVKNDYFEGIDILRVLYIEGDLTTLNLIEQTNILGDSDQVHLALEGFEALTGSEITVTAGSNALINSAVVAEYGTDSTVMVGGDVYSDALLYQAELIDTDANPLGVGLNDLTSEAVAFLAEGMIEDAQPDPLLGPPVIEDGSTSPDVMQTMLA